MSITKTQFIVALTPTLPLDIVENLLDEYLAIKQHLILARYSPSELNGGRFSECVIRLIQHISAPPHTPFGQHLSNIDQIIRQAEGNTALHESMRFYIPRLARVLLDIRNRRNVAHVGGEVDPNYSDSLLVSQVADWILIEIIRLYYNCTINEAKDIASSINQIHIPVIFNVDGFLKVQDSSLSVRSKILLLLYYSKPKNLIDTELQKWTRYSNATRFRKDILSQLDDDALIHYENNLCILTPRGIGYVEKNLCLEIVV